MHVQSVLLPLQLISFKLSIKIIIAVWYTILYLPIGCVKSEIKNAVTPYVGSSKVIMFCCAPAHSECSSNEDP